MKIYTLCSIRSYPLALGITKNAKAIEVLELMRFTDVIYNDKTLVEHLWCWRGHLTVRLLSEPQRQLPPLAPQEVE
ncbi:hypothetical protein EML15_07850 [Corynebacterium sp. sy017]|uniref:hypothetical protein n=1 Tax=unclassified Corynebacterium TaxID=2624378 RepID=UPI001187063D|nr:MULTISPECIES: hypothetical protein [unclassified Corynebacterium]MBP3089055.1 hypothetical protein [Corynebacterium sp. sy017]TSD91373.1 hypothetical protein ELY17_07860 [Corynebacterium sp. SY003]